MEAKRFIDIFIILILLVILFALSSFLFLMPKIKTNVSSATVDVLSEATPITYSADYLGKDVSKNVIIDGIVDTTHVGTYPINYILHEGPLTVKKTVIVTVQDKESPVITLNDNVDFNVCSRDSYKEPGYKAIDNYDGDITGNVKVTSDGNTITYEVGDSSGNSSTATRNLIVGDSEVPKITLNGSESVNVLLNETYNELGATAVDNCDGDLTSKIIVSSNVDTSKLASYTVTYSVSDTMGNKSEVSRKVTVIDPSTLSNPDNTNGVIYLTFDDGPGTYTNQILDVLNKYNIKATFFVTNAGSDTLILREFQEGHTIGLHTATHQWSIYTSLDTYFNDLNIVSTRVKNITGIDSKYIRFPGGSSNTISRHYSDGIMSTLTKEVESRGYQYFDWNVSVEDAGACAKRQVKDRETCVLDHFKNGLFINKNNYVLLHDIKSYTANSLEDMIKYALENGYTFTKITDTTSPCHQKLNN